MTRLALVVFFLVAFSLVLVPAGLAQNGGSAAYSGQRGGLAQGRVVTQHPPDPVLQEIERRQAREQNQRRYADLKRDADHLLQLATELKLQVDKAGEHTLSLEVIRKTDEIGKLARSVRTRMKAQ